MKRLIYLLIFFLLSNFTFVPKRDFERKGILLYHFLEPNTLYFTEDTAFLNPKKTYNKKIKLTQLLVLEDESYPEYSDSLINNFSHFKELKYYRGYHDTVDLRIAYYAKVKIQCPFFEKISYKDNWYWITFNNKSYKFITYNNTVPSHLEYSN